MTKRHTPGPWEVVGFDDRRGYVVIGVGSHIADVGMLYKNPNDEANAELIAKAPEMKDALERAKFFCKGSKLGDKVRAEINQLLESLE